MEPERKLGQAGEQAGDQASRKAAGSSQPPLFQEPRTVPYCWSSSDVAFPAFSELNCPTVCMFSTYFQRRSHSQVPEAGMFSCLLGDTAQSNRCV